MTLKVAELETLFTADYGSFEKGAKVVETTVKDLDGSKAEVIVDANVDAAERSLSDVEDALRDVDNTIAKPRIDSAGLDDFKDEAQDTAREGAASFTGQFDDVADVVQETLANALVGFGPAGAAAGLALAAGFGIALSQLQKIADEANAAKEAAGELGKEIIDAGGNIADVDVAGRIAEWGTAIIDDKQAWEIWQKEAVSNLDKVREQSDKTGLSVEALIAAQAGTNVSDVNVALREYQARLADVDAELAPLIARTDAYGQFLAGTGPQVEGLTQRENERLLSLQSQRHALDEATTATDDNREALQAAQNTSDYLRAATEGLTVAELKHRDAMQEVNDLLEERSASTRDSARAQLDLTDQVSETARVLTEIDETTGALISTEQQRSRTLIDLADQILNTASANEEAAGSTHAYNDVIRSNRQAFLDAAAAAGITGQAAEDLANSYGLIPKNVTTTVQADTEPARRAVTKLIDELTGKTIGLQVGAGTGSLRAFADGGLEDHVAQIAPAGAWRVWAEPETGGEAYIPLSPSKRGRSMAILQETASRMGAAVVPQADGSVMSTSAQSPGPVIARFSDSQFREFVAAIAASGRRSAASYSAAQDARSPYQRGL